MTVPQEAGRAAAEGEAARRTHGLDFPSGRVSLILLEGGGERDEAPQAQAALGWGIRKAQSSVASPDSHTWLHDMLWSYIN